MKRILYALVILFSCSTCKKNEPGNPNPTPATPVELKTRVVVSGLSNPWEIIYGPDNHIWFTEKSGKISRVNPENGQVNTLLTVSEVSVNGEGGMLGMAIHPDFTNNPHVYVAYNYGNPYREKVVRYTYNGSTLTNPLVLIDQIPAASIHNGCRLLIAGDKLFISTGDAANTSTPQNLNSLAGKILRLNLDGSIPADNPFPNNPVWTYGHRNAQGLTMVGTKLFASEHGPDTDDEINRIEKGRNYGWPTVKGFCNESAEDAFCKLNNVAEPLINWTPTIAPAGISYYNSDYIPQFKNSLLLVVLKGSRLMQLKFDETQSRFVDTKEFYVNAYGRLRAVCQSPAGKIYLCSGNGSNDKIIEISK